MTLQPLVVGSRQWLLYKNSWVGVTHLEHVTGLDAGPTMATRRCPQWPGINHAILVSLGEYKYLFFMKASENLSPGKFIMKIKINRLPYFCQINRR